MHISDYRNMRKSMGLTYLQLATLLGYKTRGSICQIETGRPADANGNLPARYALAIIALKERYDRGEEL